MSNNRPTGFFDRNTVTAIVLSFAVFMAWQAWVAKKYPKKEQAAVVTGTQTTGDSAQPAPSSPQTGSGVAPTHAVSGAIPPTTPDAKEELLSYDSDHIHFDLSSKGMGFKTLVLKQYTDRKNNPIAYEQESLPPIGATTVDDRNQFQISKTSENEFVGRMVDNGVQTTKTITVDSAKYLIHTKIQITSADKKIARVQTVVQGPVNDVKSTMFLPSYEHQELFVLDAEKKHRQKLALNKPFKETYNNGRIAALNSQYFALAIINRSDLAPKVESSTDGKIAGVQLFYETPQPVDQQSFNYDFYFGPKQVDVVRAADDELTLLIDYGFFAFVGKPLHALMLFMHGLVMNWGIAIVILTVVLRSSMMPLNFYSFRSMRKMQTIQPKLAAIKERFKNDPARINQETLAIMRAEKANPLSGCIPAFLQIPIFFAFYAMIASSFELYKQPFFFWIHDLTLKDPYYILPVLGSVVFFIQQKLTPPSPGMDPTQQKMMMFMPLFVTVFMLATPAGLSLYFFVNALCGFAQQMYFLKSRTT